MSTKDKVEKPAIHFEEPHHVIADPDLSTHQKAAALDTLEQDARQLATASAEGMAGGEETKLNEVLTAKETLDLPCVLTAYQVVAQDLRARALAETDAGMRALIENAAATIEPLLLRLRRELPTLR